MPNIAHIKTKAIRGLTGLAGLTEIVEAELRSGWIFEGFACGEDFAVRTLSQEHRCQISPTLKTKAIRGLAGLAGISGDY